MARRSTKGNAVTLFDQLPPSVIAARDDAMSLVEANAGESFRDRASAFVVAYLHEHGATPGETITDAAIVAGIVPHDARAFGPVYMTLARRRVIERAGYCARRKGHGTAGGSVWKLTQ